MKKIILLLLFCFVQNYVHSQDFQMMRESLARRQGQYDSGFKKVSDDYNYLMRLSLINKQNIKWLQQHKTKIAKNMQNLSNVDFSLQANVDTYQKFINSYLYEKVIMDEIILNYKMNAEIEKIKSKVPESYTQSPRFIEILKLYHELEECGPSQIKSVGVKYGFIITIQ